MITTDDDDAEGNITCQGCCETFPMNQMFQHKICGHCVLCKKCMNMHIKFLIQQLSPESKFICPSLNCSSLLTKEAIETIASEDDFNKFLKYTTSTVPKPTTCRYCNHALVCADPREPNVLICTNQLCFTSNPKAFCYFCDDEVPKIPMLSYYFYKSLGYSIASHNKGAYNWCHECHNCSNESAQTIRLFSKEHQMKHCPSCFSPIQKFDGCSHMTCKICENRFCWDCLEDLRFHPVCKNPKITETTKQWLTYAYDVGEKIAQGFLLLVSAPLLPFVFLVKKYRRYRDKRALKEFLQNNPQHSRMRKGVDIIVKHKEHENDSYRWDLIDSFAALTSNKGRYLSSEEAYASHTNLVMRRNDASTTTTSSSSLRIPNVTKSYLYYHDKGFLVRIHTYAINDFSSFYTTPYQYEVMENVPVQQALEGMIQYVATI